MHTGNSKFYKFSQKKHFTRNGIAVFHFSHANALRVTEGAFRQSGIPFNFNFNISLRKQYGWTFLLEEN